MNEPDPQYTTIDGEIGQLLDMADNAWTYNQWSVLIDAAQAIISAATVLQQWDTEKVRQQ